jgi:hypothetical protein
VPELAGPLFVFAGLLVIAGVSKGIGPRAAAGALRAMRLPSALPLVRLMGLAEVLIGAAVMVTGRAVASAALTVAYLGFGGFVAIALARELPIGSCGCFGKDDTPPTWIHLAINIAGVAVGVATTLSPIGSPSEWLPALDPHRIPYLVFTAAALLFSYIILSDLPKTMRVARRGSVARATGEGD